MCEREEKLQVTLEKRKTFRRDCCLYSKLLISFQDGLLFAHEWKPDLKQRSSVETKEKIVSGLPSGSFRHKKAGQ